MLVWRDSCGPDLPHSKYPVKVSAQKTRKWDWIRNGSVFKYSGSAHLEEIPSPTHKTQSRPSALRAGPTFHTYPWLDC